jgi:hypothetical protein
MTDDDHETWLAQARELLKAARADAAELEPSIRHLCRLAFREFRFDPSFVIDSLVVSTPSLFSEAGFSDDEVDQLMPAIDQVIEREWSDCCASKANTPPGA